MGVLVKYGFEELSFRISKGRKGLSAPSQSIDQKVSLSNTRPKRARMAIEELGPIFVKFGQLLSTRPDLIPVDYIRELEKLQDSVAAADYTSIHEEIKKELGAYPEELFAEFDKEPIAAGSIGQVHKAVLKDGRKAVLKIRRPGIEKVLRTECEILEDLSGILSSLFTEKEETLDPHRMVQEFIEAVGKEVDFANERRNQKRFIFNFSDDENIHVPEIYDDYCTGAILTMEYIDGIKPNNIQTLSDSGLDPHIIAMRGADFVLKQVFEYGFFHTDPHPGNFFVLENNILAPIDFGQVGRLGSQERRLLRDMVIGIVNHDALHIIRSLERADMIDERTDISSLLREAEALFESYYGLALKDIPFGEMMQQGFDVFRKHHVKPPSDFTLMLKSLMTIESFALSLDKDFRIIDYLKPYARKFSLEEIKPSSLFRNAKKTALGASDLLANLPEDVNAILSKFRRGKLQVRVHHEHLENLSNTLDKSSNRISFAVIIAALLIGSSLLVPQDSMALGIVHLQTLGFIGYIAAAVLGMWLLISIIRSNRL